MSAKTVFIYVDDVDSHGGGCPCSTCDRHGKSYGCAIWSLEEYLGDITTIDEWSIIEAILDWVQGRDVIERIYAPSVSQALNAACLKYKQAGSIVI